MAAAPSPTQALEAGGAASPTYFYYKEQPPCSIPTPHIQVRILDPAPFHCGKWFSSIQCCPSLSSATQKRPIVEMGYFSQMV